MPPCQSPDSTFHFILKEPSLKHQVIHYDGDVGELPPELVMSKKASAARWLWLVFSHFTRASLNISFCSSLRGGFKYADDDFDFDD
jgi:hypothetical protein